MHYFWDKLQSQLWYYQVVTFHQESHLSFFHVSLPLQQEPVQGEAGEGSETLSIFLQHHVQQETANWSVKQGCSLQVATSWAHMPLNSLWQVRSRPHGEAWRPAQHRQACSSPLQDMPTPPYITCSSFFFQWVWIVLDGLTWYLLCSFCVLTPFKCYKLKPEHRAFHWKLFLSVNIMMSD